MAGHDQGRLDYPWDTPPSPGNVVEVAPGLLWARLPLPFRLNHVNVWLLEEDDGWTVVDTGCATEVLFTTWDTLLGNAMGGKPIRRVVSTHGHVDHIGLAGWLVERFDAEFVSTFGEWCWARVAHTHDLAGADDAHLRHLLRHGVAEQTAQAMVTGRGRFIDLASTIPGAITEIRDGSQITFGRRRWQVLVTPGHSYEHASFYDAQSKVFIAGDHLLPRISPVIAVYEMIPYGDPLGDYLSSFPRFKDFPADTLVLPSHGLPYRGLHERIEDLAEHHRERLEATINFLDRPQSAFELSQAMFPHIEGPENIGFALGETLAHVNRLVSSGDVERMVLPGGGLKFQRKQAAATLKKTAGSTR